LLRTHFFDRGFTILSQTPSSCGVKFDYEEPIQDCFGGSGAIRLGAVLKEAGVKTTIFGAKETTHVKLNDNLGVAGDPATKVLLEFVNACLK